MKRTAILAIVCTLGLGLVAFAGPYFEVTQNPLLPECELVVGWDFEAPWIDQSALSVYGDFWVVNDNLWMYPTPWNGGVDLEFAYDPVNSLDFDINIGMAFALEPVPWPAGVWLDEWLGYISVNLHPGEIVTVGGQLGFTYDIQNPPGPIGWTGVFDVVPSITLECHW